MILAGNKSKKRFQMGSSKVTLKCLKSSVPSEVLVSLFSGGQSEIEAAENLI